MARTVRHCGSFLAGILVCAVSAILAFIGCGRHLSAPAHRQGPSPASGVGMIDPHQLPVRGDSDRDLLADDEEDNLRYDPDDADMNANAVPDGVDLAGLHHQIIEGLPTQPQSDAVYRVDVLQYGVEVCSICGQTVNMGYVSIVNPLTGSSLDIPYIGVHYLEHGSFSHRGDIHDGRASLVDIEAVLRDGHVHRLLYDGDKDFLTDHEETRLGTDGAHPDENGNWVRDGMELADDLAAVVEALPQGPLPDQLYKIEHLTWGSEVCAICGSTTNMGTVEIVDPVQGTSYEMPLISLHYMSHGAFTYNGDIHQGRVDVAALKELLTGESGATP
jgi:hypothetical protein